MIFQDADLEYDPGDYAAMLGPILSGEAEAVLGVRYSLGLATAGVLEHDLLVEALPITDGRMLIPGGMGGGLGVTIDERALTRYLVESAARA